MLGQQTPRKDLFSAMLGNAHAAICCKFWVFAADLIGIDQPASPPCPTSWRSRPRPYQRVSGAVHRSRRLPRRDRAMKRLRTGMKPNTAPRILVKPLSCTDPGDCRRMARQAVWHGRKSNNQPAPIFSDAINALAGERRRINPWPVPRRDRAARHCGPA
jgi:hypothetical protein